MFIKSEILYDFPRFFGILVAKLATGGVVNLTLKMKRNMIIENLDLEPKINAMVRDFLDLEILPGGKNRARKWVVRSSQVEMDPRGKTFKPIASLIAKGKLK
ncbi:hypothetical protein Tco_0045973 [Tanacetum coccineum]